MANFTNTFSAFGARNIDDLRKAMSRFSTNLVNQLNQADLATGSTGGSLTVSTTFPSSPSNGDIWYYSGTADTDWTATAGVTEVWSFATHNSAQVRIERYRPSTTGFIFTTATSANDDSRLNGDEFGEVMANSTVYDFRQAGITWRLVASNDSDNIIDDIGDSGVLVSDVIVEADGNFDWVQVNPDLANSDFTSTYWTNPGNTSDKLPITSLGRHRVQVRTTEGVSEVSQTITHSEAYVFVSATNDPLETTNGRWIRMSTGTFA